MAISCNNKILKDPDVCLANLKMDTSIVARRSLLPLVKNSTHEVGDPPWYDLYQQAYPLASTHYVFHANCDPSERLSELEKNTPVEAHFPPPALEPYSEEEARVKYLESKPTCYVLFGKPGLETESLAESLAAERKCVLISATKLMRDLDGSTIDPNDTFYESKLSCGCNVKEEAVWNYILDRLDSREVNHKGYVLEGLPLMHTEKSSDEVSNAASTCKAEENLEPPGSKDYLVVCMEDPINSESSSTSCTSKLFPSSGSFPCPVSTKSSASSSLLCACAGGSSQDRCPSCHAQFQLQEVFRNWQLKPDIVVNIVCPDEDILARYRTVDAPPPCEESDGEEHEPSFSSGPSKVVKFDDDSRSLTTFCDSVNLSDVSEKNPVAKLLKKQLDDFSNYVVNIIESFIVNHNPQNVLSIDGRYPLEHIFAAINIRLQTLPLSPVFIPQKMSRSFNGSDEEENESQFEEDSLENFFDDDLNEEFERLKKIDTVSSKFPWKLSRWGYLCPVALARGKKVEGKKFHCVRFMNLLFFLSSLDAMETFLENPRPYLVPPNPRPTCRMVVVGPRYSGKAATSKALASDFDSVVVNLREILGTSEDMDEIVNRITNVVENLSERFYSGYYRDRGWILDGLGLDFELCKRLLENDIEIETVVVLSESAPFLHLIKHWHELHPVKILSEVEGAIFSDVDQDAFTLSARIDSYQTSDFDVYECPSYYVDKMDLTSYRYSLKCFNELKQNFIDDLKNLGLNVIECDYKHIKNPAENVIEQVRKDYNFKPKYLEPPYEEETGEEEGSESDTSDFKWIHYNLGDCNSYCPVTLMEHKALWKGKADYRCSLDDKVYMMPNKELLIYFMENHYKLNLPRRKQPQIIPPFRIFLVGPLGSGKSTIGKMIAKEYGLVYVDFVKALEEYLEGRNIDVEEVKMKYLSKPDEEEAEEEDEYVDVELPENSHDFSYYYRKDILIKFYLKYVKEGAILPYAISQQCVLKYFKYPYDQCGIIFDSFPHCVKDTKIIFEQFTIPDIIIELKCDLELSEKRVMPIMIEEWKLAQEKIRDAAYCEFNQEMDAYLQAKHKWLKAEKIKLYLQKRCAEKEAQECSSNEEIEAILNDDSDCDTNSMCSDAPSIIATKADFNLRVTDEDEMELEEIYAMLHQPPKMSNDFESVESAKDRFAFIIEEHFERSVQNLFLLFNFFANETVPWLEVDANASMNQVFITILYALTPMMQRSSCFFEKTMQIENAVAERLLACGYYFLSSFGRFCPVQTYNSKNPFNMFLPLAEKMDIFAVLHRQYVYFLAGQKALEDFKKEPLKYLNYDSQMPMVPVMLSIIGPPKCGKTTVSKRFAKTYDLEVVSRDETIHYVLSNFPDSQLSASIRTSMQTDNCVNSDQLAESTKLFMSNPGCLTQGIVFDGFPLNIEETQAFVKRSIAPMIVIDLVADLEFTAECNEGDEEASVQEVNSATFPCHKEEYCEWELDADIFRQWLVANHANVVTIDATKNKAAVWKLVDEKVRFRLMRILDYLRKVGYDAAQDLQFMCVTPAEINLRASRFGLHCPACILEFEAFHTLDCSTGRKGLVQYREHFYWLCEMHYADFVKRPSRSVKVYEDIELPDDYPIYIHDEIDLKNECWTSRLRYNGYCPVVYFDNIPRRKLVCGCPEYGVVWKECLYLMSSEEARCKFCKYFPKYTREPIHMPQVLKQPDLWKMPNLGFLEQSVAHIIVHALGRVGRLRPKLPYLSPETSAAVYLGAYLKTYLRNLESPKYEVAVRKMEARHNLVKIMAEIMKRKSENIEDIHEDLDGIIRLPGGKLATRKSGSILDLAVVKFKKTSPSQILADTDDSDL